MNPVGTAAIGVEPADFIVFNMKIFAGKILELLLRIRGPMIQPNRARIDALGV